jgi:hypothetical protein
MADAPNSAAHVIEAMASSFEHAVEQRWIALAPGGRGRRDLPSTVMIMTEPAAKFSLLNRLLHDARDFDWVVLCDDDVEVGADFIDTVIRLAERHDFALAQPARTADSYIDHPFVQVMPGLAARRTRFVEIGPVTCVRRDAFPLLLPFDKDCGMGWGLDFVWPVRLEKAGLRMGIIDATPVAHRLRRPVTAYDYAESHGGMAWLLAGEHYLAPDDAFTILDAYP